MSAALSIMPIDSAGPLTRQERLAIESRIKRSGLHSTAVRLLMEIAELAGFGRNPEGCFATTATLLERLGNPVKPRQAGNLLRELEEVGWIIVLRVGGSQSRFARRCILLGPRCLNGPTSAPSNPMTMHLAIPYHAPSNPVPALPPTGEESRRTTTTEPRESLSFSSRPDSERRNAPTPETSPDVPPPSAPGAAPKLDPTALDQAADRIAALKLVATSAKVLRAQIDEYSLRIGRPPAVFLDWLTLAINSAEARENGDDPVRGWKWFEGVLGKWHKHGGPSLPGARKPPVVQSATQTVHRRSDDDPNPPERMSVQELDQAIAEVRINHDEALANQGRSPSQTLQTIVDNIGARLAVLERERSTRPPGVDER